MRPEQCRHHRRRSRTYHDLECSPSARPNCSICSSFVDVHTTSSSQVQSSQPFAPNVRVIHFLFTRCPSAHRFLSVSLQSGRSIHPDTLSSRELQDGMFRHGFAKADPQVRTILVDTCCPSSGFRIPRLSTSLSQQTIALHVLSPVLVLAFSSHLCTNDTDDTVQRYHRMSLGPRPRPPICLSISTLLLS